LILTVPLADFPPVSLSAVVGAMRKVFFAALSITKMLTHLFVKPSPYVNFQQVPQFFSAKGPRPPMLGNVGISLKVEYGRLEQALVVNCPFLLS